ncbi:MAG: hypothetical protein UU14_C0002G0012 [Candidatus Roizmanbacteria bacterium GW2011_GWB1_40_7]|uniref:Uncharacterized protein n=2 Tax=Candidatus Roizmaniibacteriota TaxID=1752723 RepID=A0A0G0T6Y6_9BACT|nr:MAG: hypothetical protein UT85_C0004G0029 [Candidatus Levybacteria bacterium GW2011_GWA2_40_16]KKR72759.1 MAG: hypothetical protein UU14_C0002G0012 [Candidatus Roizmanbacteria bacterium GW2011_GWB1_40_7]KKR94456.1 MAG: hypothetical protein UU41_C0006G0002 [Candidatus Roizmanbacteria bacterium GW2011_GWA1_41_13]
MLGHCDPERSEGEAISKIRLPRRYAPRNDKFIFFPSLPK